MAPTYFLYSGQLFHEAAIAFIASGTPHPKHDEDPGPEGPEGEHVGDDDDDDDDDDDNAGDGDDQIKETSTRAPAVGPKAPMVPDHGSPDANPIDPRVFLSMEHH